LGCELSARALVAGLCTGEITFGYFKIKGYAAGVETRCQRPTFGYLPRRQDWQK